ncbi:MAG: hypothetical protein QNJ38_18940 [Prochloraceae cyanobacterium]|nr:hypothetical protein [Prochloraceae cyanobacterium]
MDKLNEKVIQSRKQLSPLRSSLIAQMCDCLLLELGEPNTPLEKDALRSLQHQKYDRAKQYCLADPCNSYLAALSCIASAYRSPMVADSVLRDAARHVAEVSKLRTQKRIGDRFFAIISSQSS